MKLKAEWAIDSEPIRARGIIFFRKIQLVGQKYRDQTTFPSKMQFSRHCFGFNAGAFRHWWAITYSLVVAQPIRTQH